MKSAMLFKKEPGNADYFPDLSTMIKLPVQELPPERHSQIVFENIPTDVQLWQLVRDERGQIETCRLVDINPSGLETLKMTRVQVVGKTADAVYPDAVEHLISIVQQVVSEGTPQSWEKHCEESDQIIKMTCVPLGEYVLTIGTDITANLDAAGKLEERDEWFRALVEASSDVVYRMSPNWSKVYQLIGRDFIEDTERPNQTWLQKYIHPDDQSHVINAIKEAVRTKSVFELEHRVLRVDGSLGWTFSRAVPILDDDGHITEWLGMASDITERKQIEQELRQREEKYRNLFESIDEGFCIVEVLFDDLNNPNDYVFLEVNPSFERQTGIRNAIGRRMREIAPEHEATWFEVFGRIAITGTPERFELPAVALDSHYDVYAFRVDEPEKHRVAMLFNDITERKRAARQRLEMEMEVRLREMQKLESLGVLAGGIAHDFNNILMGIVGYVELAMEELPPSSPAREYISRITNSTTQAAGLCKQMLAYAGKSMLERQDISLRSLIEEMLDMLNAAISKKCALKLCVSPQLPIIFGDRVQLSQVLMNLIINASEAMGEDNGVITLSAGIKECLEGADNEHYIIPPQKFGQHVYLEVADTGSGIEPVALQRIFDPFYTTKFTGRGLGLSAVMGIVRSHAGALQVESKPGEGAVFRVLFPSVEKESNAAEGIVISSCFQRKGTVLIVDDDEIVRTLNEERLLRMGLNVMLAINGRQAVEIYRQHSNEIDVVLLDLTMPEMNGEEAYHEMRKINPDVSVILASGYSENDIIARFDTEKLAGFLLKPYTQNQLRELLTELLPAS